MGGYSSRPGAAEVPPEQEWLRVERGVATVRRLAPGMAVSVDTFHSEVPAALYNVPNLILRIVAFSKSTIKVTLSLLSGSRLNSSLSDMLRLSYGQD